MTRDYCCIEMPEPNWFYIIACFFCRHVVRQKNFAGVLPRLLTTLFANSVIIFKETMKTEKKKHHIPVQKKRKNGKMCQNVRGTSTYVTKYVGEYMARSSNVADDGMRPYKHAATRQQRNHADWYILSLCIVLQACRQARVLQPGECSSLPIQGRKCCWLKSNLSPYSHLASMAEA